MRESIIAAQSEAVVSVKAHRSVGEARFSFPFGCGDRSKTNRRQQ